MTVEKQDRLKMVIAVRHGEYSRDDHKALNEKGRAQSQEIAKKLNRIIPPDYSIAIFSSPHTRAVQTAEFISLALGASGYDILGILSKDSHSQGKYARLSMLERSEGYDVLIAVTHYELPSGIAHAFVEHHLGGRVECHETKKGNGIMVDLTKKKVIYDLLAHQG